MYLSSATRIALLLSLVFLVFADVVNAEIVESQATGKAVIIGNINLEQAKAQALNRARSNAVEQAVGVRVSSDTIIKNAFLLSELIKTFSYGYIIEETDFHWKGYWTQSTLSDPGFPVIEVQLKAKVKVPAKSFHKTSAMSVKLNQQNFLHGESAKLVIEPAYDMYLLIANFTSNNQIVPVYPNQYNEGKLLNAGQVFEFPPRKNANIKLILETQPGHTHDDEAFIILGIPKTTLTDKINWQNLFGNRKQLSYPEFFDIIVDLPVPWICEKTLIYTIRAR